MDIQKLVNSISEAGQQERSHYHATYGDLIDKLKNADESMRITPQIIGIGAYRGYYSDIALCTESAGFTIFNTEDYDDWKNCTSEPEIPQNPKELAVVLESIIGKYFDGYKGGHNEIARDKPIWLATDYGDCSSIAVVEITDDLRLVTKIID